MPTDLSLLNDAMCDLIDCRQGDRDVNDYIDEFQALNDRVLLIIAPPPTTDTVKREEQRQLMIIVLFLRGLLADFGPARTRVLNQVPTPTFQEVVETMFRYEAYLKGSASISVQEGNERSFSNGGGRSRAACSRCHRRGHTRDACGVLSGRPS